MGLPQWEKPEELSLFEQQQQQKLQPLQKSAVPQLQTQQTQAQLAPQVQSTQQHMGQLQQAQGQMQIRQQAPTQQLQPALVVSLHEHLYGMVSLYSLIHVVGFFFACKFQQQYQAPGAVSNQITQVINREVFLIMDH